MLRVYVVIGIVFLVICGGFYGYFKYSQGVIADLNADNARLTDAVAVQEQVIGRLEGKIIEIDLKMNEIGEKYAQIEHETRQTSEILSRHDLGRLAEAKPGLIERRVNSGTARVLEEFERITQP